MFVDLKMHAQYMLQSSHVFTRRLVSCVKKAIRPQNSCWPANAQRSVPENWSKFVIGRLYSSARSSKASSKMKHDILNEKNIQRKLNKKPVV